MSYLIQITASVTVRMPDWGRTSKQNQMLCSLSVVVLGQDLTLSNLFSDARNMDSF